MSSFTASAPPDRAARAADDGGWEATRALTGLATQIMSRDKAEQSAVVEFGRRVGDAQWELFVACEPAEALQQHFEQAQPEFIALHDIGIQASRRMLMGLAAAMGRPVHQLHIRRQGVGMPLAKLEFIELPVPENQPPLRMYTTETDADTAQRRRLMRALLGFSRLGVVMVGDLPPHALATALLPLRDAIAEGPWANRELLMLPLAAASVLAGQAGTIAGRSMVNVRTTPLVTRPAEAWSYLRASWNKIREQLADDAIHIAELLDPAPAGAARAAAATAAAPQSPSPAAAPAAPAHKPLPMQPMPKIAAAMREPDPAATDPALATYLRRCGELKGMISCCVFELATQRSLGHVGSRPGPAALAASGSSLMAALAEAGHALGLGDEAPDAAITHAAHHELLRAVPGRPGLAMHAVLDKAEGNLTLVRLQLQRLDLLLEDGAPK